MSQIGDAIQAKCLAFGDRIIKLNDYLLEQAASSMSDVGGRKPDISKGKSAFIHHTSDIIHQPSYIIHHTSAGVFYNKPQHRWWRRGLYAQ